MIEVSINGKHLQELRKKNDFTQEALAEKTGLSDRYIRKLESGESQPGAKAVYLLSNALDVTMEELITVTEVPDEEIKK